MRRPALDAMRRNGWVDDETAAAMAFKAGSEVMTAEPIGEILEQSGEEPPAPLGSRETKRLRTLWRKRRA